MRNIGVCLPKGGIGKTTQLISCQIYVWGKFVKYSGTEISPEDLDLPPDIKIEPWEPLPNMALLTIQGVTVAGPARLELLRSFAHQLCTDPQKAQELTAIRWEVNTVIKKEV